jgi:hypothetical protein
MADKTLKIRVWRRTVNTGRGDLQPLVLIPSTSQTQLAIDLAIFDID